MNTTLKLAHILAAYLSISLFILRGVLMFLDSDWRKHPAMRAIPSAVDGVLVVSALILVFLVHQYPGVDHWLTAKVVGLVIYIVLGAIALGRGRTQGIRIAAFVGAVGVFAYILAVSVARHPFLLSAGG